MHSCCGMRRVEEHKMFQQKDCKSSVRRDDAKRLRELATQDYPRF